MSIKLVIPESVKNRTALQKPNVSTQEIGQYGKGNIDLKNRQIAYNDDGSISTLRSMSFNDGKNEILIPTVVNGKVVSDKDAINHYYNTGEYLGKFNTVKEADDYANELHKQQEVFYTPRVDAYKTLLNATNNGNVMTYNDAANQRINEVANLTSQIQGPQPQKQPEPTSYDDEIVNSSHFRRGHGQTKTFNRTSGIYNDRENSIEILKTPENMEDNLRRFDDGYNFGDVAKTVGEYAGEGLLDVGNTVAEAPFRVTKGLLSVPENLANLGAGFAAGVSDIAGDLTGNPYLNQYATNIRKNVVNENNFFKPANEALDKLGDYYGKNSFAGKTLKSAEEATGQTIGQLAVTQALGAAGGKTEIPIKFGNNHVLNVPVTALATGLGSGVKESYTIADQQLGGIENATWRDKAQIALRALRSGAVEGVTEGMFGLLGMGGSDITDKLADEAVKKASNAFEKQLIKIMYAGGGEAAEEFVSYAANWLFDNDFINKAGNLDYSKDWNWDEVMEEMASAFISAGFSQGAANLQNVRQTTKRAMNTAEDVAKARGLPLSQSEKATIKNNAADIALTEEQQELKPNLASVYSSYAPNVYENKTAPSSEQLRQGMSKYIQSTQENNQDNGAKTRFSLGGEESTIRQSSNQLTKYKVPEQFINLSEYIMRQRPGLTIRVDENIPENGRYNEKTREIVINPSKLDRALEFTLVHELGHDFKTGDQSTYEALQKYVLDFARTKQGFEEAKKSLNAEYLKKLKEKDFVLNDEATNDILGQILGNQDYLNNMYQTDRNLFQKIYDWFRNVLFDGNKTGLSYNERKYLNEIQRRFENAFNQEYKGKGNAIKYSMQDTTTDSEGNKLTKEQQEYFKDSKVRDDNGDLLVVHHGTAAGEFYTFDQNKLNPESDWGSGIYFTSSESDVEANYTGGGPDFENKVALLAERIQDEQDISYEEAKDIARQQLEVEPYQIDAYINIKNPAIVGKTNLFEVYDEDLDVEESDYETENEYYEALNIARDEALSDMVEDALSEVRQKYGSDYNKDIQNAIYELYYDYGEVEPQKLKDKLGEVLIDAGDDNGNLISSEIARLIIQSQGYDGIIDNTVSGKFNMNLSPDTTHYVVFNSNQVKNISNETPTENPDIRYSLSETPYEINDGFYSQVEKVISTKMANKADAQTIMNLLNKNGAKQDELDWLDMDNFLASKSSFTKQEVLDYIKANQLQIEEIRKGMTQKERDELLEGIQDELLAANEEIVDKAQKIINKYGYNRSNVEDWFFHINRDNADIDDYFEFDYFNYDAENDYEMFEDYKNELRDLYEKWRENNDEIEQTEFYDYDISISGKETRFDEYTTDFNGYNDYVDMKDENNYREVLFTLPNMKGDVKPFYAHQHWGATKNVLAHTRFKDYTDDSGNKVLFVEEIQSDMHEEGRKKGYSNQAEADEISKKLDKKREDRDNLIRNMEKTEEYKEYDKTSKAFHNDIVSFNEKYNVYRESDIYNTMEKYYDIDALLNDEWYKNKQITDLADAYYRNLMAESEEEAKETAKNAIDEFIELNWKDSNRNKRDNIIYKKFFSSPLRKQLDTINDDVRDLEIKLDIARSGISSRFPFKKTWHEFVIRKIINEAVQKGYDKVAWTTGLQQSKRYTGLLQENIDRVDYYKNDNGTYELTFMRNGNAIMQRHDVDEKQLVDLVGKDMSSKIINNKEDSGKLEGIDISVGGEGMKGFYDKIIPDYVRKYIKKWGGTLEDVVINGNHQQGFTITPEMREAVENEGQVLFSKSDKNWDSFLKNDMNLMPNANKSFAERINNQVKNDVNALNLGKSKVDITENKSYNGVERNNENQYVTAAPYREENVNDKNYESKKAKVEGTFLNKANEISRQLGVKIKNISDNMGGFVSQQGKNKGNFVNEVSYTFELENATKEQADMLASIMADTGFETQEAVISSNYTDEGEGNAIEVIFKVNSLKGIPGILKRLGIQEYTIDRANKEIKLFQSDFSSITDQNLADLSMELGGNLYGTETTNVESRYIDAETRRDIYQKWLETTKESEENRELRNSISEALKAVNKELESQENSEQGSFLNDNKIGEEGSKAFNLQEEKAKGEELVNDPEKFFSDKVKTRSWTETVKKNKYISDNVTLDELYYEPQSNKSLIDKASKAIEQNGYESTLNELEAVMNSGKNITDKDLAKGELLMTQAVKEGRLDDAVRLHSDLTIMLTELGRAVQAASIISRLTPEGQLMHLERVIKRMNAKNLEQDKDAPTIKLTDEDKKAILGAKDAADLEQIMEDTLQHIADQMPVTLWDKLDAWRYLAMLGNPRTHVRNTVANVVMKGVTGAKNVTARAIETALQKNLKERTRTFEKASQDVLDFVKQDAEDMRDILSGNKYGNTDQIMKKRKIFKNDLLEKARKFNDKALEVEDTIFTVAQYKKSLAEYLTANGIKTQKQIKDNPKLIEKARTHAIKEAEESTFHQANKFSQKLNELEQSGVAGKIIVGGAIPFKKTPANIVTTGAKYSPLGLGESVLIETARLKKGKITANEYIDRISQGLTGTGLTLLGVFLAKIGLISGSSKDKDEKYKESIGARQAYSLNIGDKHYDLSWASPSAMPLMVGAELYETLEKKDADLDINDAIDALTKTLDPLSEMSMIQSINSTLKTYSSEGASGAILGAAKNAGKSYASQFIPTLGSQFNKIVDKTARTTKASRTAPIKDVDSFLRQSANKTPFASFLLEPSTDVWGRNNERGNVIERSFEALINPGAVKKDKSTDVDKEILKLYEINNNDDIIPKTPNDYFQMNNVKYELSAKEYTDFKKKYGQTTYTQLQKLIKSSEYKSKSTEEKEKAIKKVYDNALKQVKKDYVKNQ